MTETNESRGTFRYVTHTPINGSFGSVAMVVRDLADNGVQIEHAEPLRVATKSRLAFAGAGSQILQMRGIVIWSRLSAVPNEAGKYLYRSGVRVDDEPEVLTHAIGQLLGKGLIYLDQQSLDRKREILAEKARAKGQMGQMRLQRPSQQMEGATPDQLLLIQHARERLRSHPEEALKWYNRAKYALPPEESRALDEGGMRHKEDVLAVWEYLERSIELPVIAKAFGKN